jgi:flagellar motility protein MotE (MotC chaperone)
VAVSSSRSSRIALVAAMAVNALVVGAWWWTGMAHAERAVTEPLVAPDLFARSRGFRELLEAVRQRGEDLDRRERALSAREVTLKVLAGGLEQAPHEAAPAACKTGIARAYQSMQPEDAAPILAELDDATVRRIFACMKERQIGALLAVMRRERAVALTRMLAAGR